MDDKHILVSLGDEKAKAISEVIGDKTCNKILDFLAETEATVSDISYKLKMPLNTVDYNIKKLVKAGLIEKGTHWWSVKGKKMPVYRVSNKQIIISPKKSITKVFAWVIGLTGLTSLTIKQFMGSSKTAGEQIMYVARDSVEEAMPMLSQKATMEVAPAAVGAGAVNSSGGFLAFVTGLSPWSWFLIGAWFAVLLFFLFTLISERRK